MQGATIHDIWTIHELSAPGQEFIAELKETAWNFAEAYNNLLQPFYEEEKSTEESPVSTCTH
jgi:hypothetical protein